MARFASWKVVRCNKRASKFYWTLILEYSVCRIDYLSIQPFLVFFFDFTHTFWANITNILYYRKKIHILYQRAPESLGTKRPHRLLCPSVLTFVHPSGSTSVSPCQVWQKTTKMTIFLCTLSLSLSLSPYPFRLSLFLSKRPSTSRKFKITHRFTQATHLFFSVIYSNSTLTQYLNFESISNDSERPFLDYHSSCKLKIIVKLWAVVDEKDILCVVGW